MKPKDVNKSNENDVWDIIFGHRNVELPLPKFKIGNTVRISKYKSTFTKGCEASFTEELFKISKVIHRDQNVYELEDLEGEAIIGKFYEELIKKDDIY